MILPARLVLRSLAAGLLLASVAMLLIAKGVAGAVPVAGAAIGMLPTIYFLLVGARLIGVMVMFQNLEETEEHDATG